MPVYEYLCKECGAKFEVLRKIGQYHSNCPKCNSIQIEKKLSIFDSLFGKKNADGCSSSPFN